jgi:hypothetical protein
MFIDPPSQNSSSVYPDQRFVTIGVIDNIWMCIIRASALAVAGNNENSNTTEFENCGPTEFLTIFNVS